MFSVYIELKYWPQMDKVISFLILESVLKEPQTVSIYRFYLLHN